MGKQCYIFLFKINSIIILPSITLFFLNIVVHEKERNTSFFYYIRKMSKKKNMMITKKKKVLYIVFSLCEMGKIFFTFFWNIIIYFYYFLKRYENLYCVRCLCNKWNLII